MMAATVSSLSDDALACNVFAALHAFDLRRAACACRHWRDRITPLAARRLCCVVTSAGSNEIVLFDADGRVAQRIRALPPPKRKRHGSAGGGGGGSSWRAAVGAPNWPTCLALGPHGELYASQVIRETPHRPPPPRHRV